MSKTGLRILAGLCICLSVGVVVNVLFLQRGGQSHQTTGGVVEGVDRADFAAVRSGPTAGASERQSPSGAPTRQPPRQLVRAIQRELHQRDYFQGRVDGKLGILTRAAIMAYETDNGLALTADAREELLRALLLGASPGPAASRKRVGPEAKSVIRLVQGLLAKVGYARVDRTGKLDAVTRHAITSFEQRNNLQPKGRISAELVRLLQRTSRNG